MQDVQGNKMDLPLYGNKICIYSFIKGCLPIAKLKKYKLESSDLGATWAIWLPTYVDSKTQLTPKSDNVNEQKFMRSAWVMSELWTMALNNMHPCRFSLKLFVVTFVLTYTFYTLHFSSALYKFQVRDN